MTLQGLYQPAGRDWVGVGGWHGDEGHDEVEERCMAGDQSIIAPVGLYRLQSHRAATVNVLAGILRGSMKERAWLNTHLL